MLLLCYKEKQELWEPIGSTLLEECTLFNNLLLNPHSDTERHPAYREAFVYTLVWEIMWIKMAKTNTTSGKYTI